MGIVRERILIPKTTVGTIINFIIAFFLPPLAVFFEDGCHAHFVINILLFFFTVWIGAVIHAFYIVYRGHRAIKQAPVVQHTATYA